MKYIIGVLGAILAILVVFALVFRADDKPNQANVTTAKLVDYSKKNSSVSFTTYGRLVGNDQRRAIRITVNANERRIEVLNGYNESVSSVQTYANTQDAYANFLSALGNYGFDRSRTSSITDPRGQCPSGNRYSYELTEAGQSKSNLWATTCETKGTFAGNGPTVRNLFKQQIPDYEKQVQPVKL